MTPRSRPEYPNRHEPEGRGLCARPKAAPPPLPTPWTRGPAPASRRHTRTRRKRSRATYRRVVRRRARTLAGATRPAAPTRRGSEPAEGPPAGGTRDRRLGQPAPQKLSPPARAYPHRRLGRRGTAAPSAAPRGAAPTHSPRAPSGRRLPPRPRAGSSPTRAPRGPRLPPRRRGAR
eukprot:4290577-Prymnesium_polylepis.1